MKKLLVIAALAAIAPLVAQAESNLASGTGAALSASAKLNFSISVPKVLFLQVGTGTSYTAYATVDNISFVVPGGSVGNGTAVAGTGGDLTAGAVTVRVLGNSGTVTLNSGVTGPLSSGVAGNPTVPWSEIKVTSDALASTTTGFTNTGIAHPAFNLASGAGTATTLDATGGLVRQEGKWTFAYANNATLPAGTYGNTDANHGVVTYTATTP